MFFDPDDKEDQKWQKLMDLSPVQKYVEETQKTSGALDMGYTVSLVAIAIKDWTAKVKEQHKNPDMYFHNIVTKMAVNDLAEAADGTARGLALIASLSRNQKAFYDVIRLMTAVVFVAEYLNHGCDFVEAAECVGERAKERVAGGPRSPDEEMKHEGIAHKSKSH